MSLKEIFEVINNNRDGLLWVLIICSMLVEVTPIKVNPISWVFQKIGAMANGEILGKLSAQDEAIKGLREDVDGFREEISKTDATNRRYRILRFNDEILHEVYHSREHFEQVLIDCDEYERYCDEHKDTYRNSVCEMAIANIKKTYADCCKKNSFL